jgi:hypothetical protein
MVQAGMLHQEARQEEDAGRCNQFPAALVAVAVGIAAVALLTTGWQASLALAVVLVCPLVLLLVALDCVHPAGDPGGRGQDARDHAPGTARSRGG